MIPPSMTEAEAHACPPCDRCGSRLTRPAAPSLGYAWHWACLSDVERDEVRAAERDTRAYWQDVADTDRSLARTLAAEDVRDLRERDRLGTL